MTEQEVIDKVCDRVVNNIYNELDYYMFEELGFMETNDEYVKYADKLIVKIIKELKNFYDRPRPNVLAKKMNIKLDMMDIKSAKTPSYPSGHTAQGYLIALVLSDKHPKNKKAFMKLAKDISDSRNMAKVHYKSDSVFGKKLGEALYKHIKNKI